MRKSLLSLTLLVCTTGSANAQNLSVPSNDVCERITDPNIYIECATTPLIGEVFIFITAFGEVRVGLDRVLISANQSALKAAIRQYQERSGLTTAKADLSIQEALSQKPTAIDGFLEAAAFFQQLYTLSVAAQDIMAQINIEERVPANSNAINPNGGPATGAKTKQSSPSDSTQSGAVGGSEVIRKPAGIEMASTALPPSKSGVPEAAALKRATEQAEQRLTSSEPLPKNKLTTEEINLVIAAEQFRKVDLAADGSSSEAKDAAKKALNGLRVAATSGPAGQIYFLLKETAGSRNVGLDVTQRERLQMLYQSADVGLKFMERRGMKLDWTQPPAGFVNALDSNQLNCFENSCIQLP